MTGRPCGNILFQFEKGRTQRGYACKNNIYVIKLINICKFDEGSTQGGKEKIYWDIKRQSL